jgi:hypothetical protein
VTPKVGIPRTCLVAVCMQCAWCVCVCVCSGLFGRSFVCLLVYAGLFAGVYYYYSLVAVYSLFGVRSCLSVCLCVPACLYVCVCVCLHTSVHREAA